MNGDFSHPNNPILTWISILAGIVLYFIYYFLQDLLYRKNLVISDDASLLAHIRSVRTGKVMGVFFLGIVPIILLHIFFEIPYTIIADAYTAGGETLVRSLLWLLVLAPLILVITYAGSKRDFLRSSYPEIRVQEWTRLLLARYLFWWLLYLVAYEFFFRYLFFYMLIEPFGLFGAIAFNTGLYCIAHAPKGIVETIGALPLGLALCVATYDTGSILTACIAHVIVSFSTVLFCFYHSDDMRLTKT